MKPQIIKAGLPSQIGKWKTYLVSLTNFRLLAATITLYIALTSVLKQAESSKLAVERSSLKKFRVRSRVSIIVGSSLVLWIGLIVAGLLIFR